MLAKKNSSKATPIPRALRKRVEELLQENYAFMDSPIFRRKNIEAELFTEDAERDLPLTTWYQPTRDDAFEGRVRRCSAAHEGSGRAAHVPALQLRQASAQPASAQGEAR
jgi:hypothetical protein